MTIHSTALIDPGAKLALSVEVGPYTVIGKDVEIGEGTKIGAHAVILGPTRIGRDNQIFHFVSLGEAPQDKKYAGEPTRLEIGDRNTIREYCTFNRGTVQDAGVTRLGDDNWIMAYVHLAHDCQIGNHTIFANNATLGGHVHVGDYAVLGGLTGVHQFVHVGAHSITAAGTVLLQDLPPYVIAGGNTAKPYGINVEGLKRRGYAAETMVNIKRAYKTLYKSSLSLAEAKAEISADAADCPELQILVDFLATAQRGIIR
ncbi:MAG: acyl-ACP--UDP-N-acetylglucosamine O-acyltransferase [Burkholderiales bacterium]|nr:acyl-ACP--UDP-N-acetylglucosamine O-acyltransferase [Burkholderiales bacterium]